MKPEVTAFFDEPTNTASYVVADPTRRKCAIVDSVLDFDPASGRTATRSADRLLAFIQENRFAADWILETHVHADHLSAAPYLQKALGGKIAIGADVAVVQKTFGDIFNAEPAFRRDGGQFDALFNDGDLFHVGALSARAIATPGHTPACMTYLVGDAAFVGDTMFMPDYGTARCDFPGGDAAELYRSIQRIFALPSATRLFMCHDYKAPGRTEFKWESTVAEERARNIHVRDGVSEAEFVDMRTARDKTLSMPRLLLPSVQVNMRAGAFPPPDSNGAIFLKLPVDRF
ncbi:MAG: MBL fold metallo-hydrolase [Parvularculaceae bacterium]